MIYLFVVWQYETFYSESVDFRFWDAITVDKRQSSVNGDGKISLTQRSSLRRINQAVSVWLPVSDRNNRSNENGSGYSSPQIENKLLLSICIFVMIDVYIVCRSEKMGGDLKNAAPEPRHVVV